MTDIEKKLYLLSTPIIEMYCDGDIGVEFYNACNDFFTYSQKVRPNKLLECSPKNLLPIGNAFAMLALETDFGNPDINSISAENAIYCLLTYQKNVSDYFNIPYNAAVSLLLSDKNPLHDGLMYVLGLRLWSVDILNELKFYKGEISIRSAILKYLIPKIFDLNKRDFKIDDLPLAPHRKDILWFINSVYFKEADESDGKELLEELYNFCRLGVAQP